MKKEKTSDKDISILDEIPKLMPILPLRDAVIFPYMIFPVLVGREQSIKAANASLDESKYIFVTPQKNSSIEEPTDEDIYLQGTVAKIIQILKLPNGLLKILLDGVIPAEVKKITKKDGYMVGEIKLLPSKFEENTKFSALNRQMTELFKEYTSISKKIPPEAFTAFDSIEQLDRRLFYVATSIIQSIEVKHKILEEKTLEAQFMQVIQTLLSEIELLKLEREIEGKVHTNITKAQRKYIINEQIRLLKEELGENTEENSDFTKYSNLIKKAKLPKDVLEKANEELEKFKRTPPLSPESTVIRNYLEWITDLPWNKRTKDNLNIENVKKILDDDHFGLEKPKERILENIAVLNLVKSMRGQILCFVGPPGVGKTSLGKSIARALGREFVRISLGGVKDEAEIRGHRRTYIGSMPGKIIQSMKKAKTINPLILLDEIDKMSADFRGDPSSAMLEVLDPEQNHAFNDHYLEVDYDLSQVMFITTANVRYNIPLPLQDRMEIIEIPGYLDFEKVEIAKQHIIQKQIELNGLMDYEIDFRESSIKKIISEYTREAGVRNLEREITSVLRKTVREIVSKRQIEKSKKSKIIIDDKKIEKYLGIPKFRKSQIEEKEKIGSVTGLAWTSVGGEILNVEASIMDGAEKLILTGQLGDVMKESAQAALTYLKSNAKEFGIPQTAFKNKQIHIHLPEGAIPKDGPSAGITLTMTLFSALTKKPAKSDIAMTGEITLRGKVLAIGGLNEKLLAARRYGIKRVLIPSENEKDLAEIKEPVKEGLEIIPISTIKEAIPLVFEIEKSSKRKKNA